MSGGQLFEWVEQFASLGHHRTGSEVDRRTVDWAAEWLGRFGFDLRIEPVELPLWRGSGQVLVDGEPIEHLAVPYSFTGRVSSGVVQRIGLDVMSGGFPGVLDDPMASAGAAGAGALVVATRHPLGDLVGVNRHGFDVVGMPTFLVAGRHEERLAEARVEIDYHADVEIGHTWNLVATSSTAAADMMVTTPLNGWFTCAGERGTGIAVTLDLARRLVGESIDVVLTGGHELGFVGAHRFADVARYPAVFHVGASVAVEHDAEGVRQLIPTRSAMCSESRDAMPGVFDAFAAIGLNTIPSSTTWMGEATAWSRWGVPLVSSTGAGVDFHTPSDLPGRVTSPEALTRVSSAYRLALENFRFAPGSS